MKCVLFDTAIGRCGLAWSDNGLTGVQLPEASDAATRARLARRLAALGNSAAPHDSVQQPDTHPPPEAQAAIAGITALLAGARDDLRHIRLDMTGVPAFHQRVYAVARDIPPGQTLTYGEVAARLGEPRAARAVGQALGANPFAPVVPCHRVLAAGGRAGGFSANGGTDTKLRMLLIERAQLGAGPGLFDG